MAKRSYRRPVGHERNQHGCMWGIISMFDFRRGRTTGRLLLDRRRESRLVAGDGNAKNKLGILTNIDETFQNVSDGEESGTEAVDAGKPSVKKLIEEEMINELDIKESINDKTVAKESNLAHKGHKRNCKGKNKSCSKCCDLPMEGLDADEKLELEKSSSQKLEEKAVDMVNIDQIMEEFCHQIHQRSANCVRYDQCSEAHEHQKERNYDFEETLIKALKVFVNQKRINGNQWTEDENTYSSKEITNVLQKIDFDDELFLELLQGPESEMVKYLQNLCSAPREKDEFFKSYTESNLLDHDIHTSQHIGQVMHTKQHSFFRRRFKSQLKNSATEEKASEVSNQIVILKPGPTSFLTPESKGTSLVEESELISRNKELKHKVGSLFFFTEIKRKLKHAVGKERQEVPTDRKEKIFKEHFVKSCPSKDHFFMEKIAKPIMGVKKGYKTGEVKECESSMDNEVITFPKKNVDDIYIEARKHLSLMLSTEGEDTHSPSRRVCKPLGRILSLPEYNNYPVGNPQRDLRQRFVTTETQYSASSKIQNQDDTKSCLGPTTPNIETQSSVSDKCTDDKSPPASSPRSGSEVDESDIYETHNNSPVGSPERDLGQSFVTTEIRYSANNEFQNQDHTESCLGPTAPNVKTQLFVSDKCTNDKAPPASSPRTDSDADESDMNETHNNITIDWISEGEVEIVKPTEVALQIMAGNLDSISEPSIVNITGYDQIGDTFETCDEERSPEQLNNDLYIEKESLSSPPLTSPSTPPNAKNVEDPLIATEVLEQPSPVSILELLITEDGISPASTRTKSVELSVEPIRIHFEELKLLAANRGMNLRSCTDDKESVFNYVNAVLQASGVNWDDFYMKFHSLNQLLDPSLLDEIEFFPNQLCYEKKLLFDCINEVLVEIFLRYFGCSSGFFSSKRTIRPVPGLKDAIFEVCIGVYWHLLPLPLPHNLEQIVKKDMSKSGTWMDLRCDVEAIVFEISEIIFNDLLEKTILTSTKAHLKSANPFVAVEFKDEESSNDL